MVCIITMTANFKTSEHFYFYLYSSCLLFQTLLVLSTIRRSEKLGLEDGSIPDESLSASSNWNDGYFVSTPAAGRLNKIPPDDKTIGAWHARVKDTNQWIQVDLGNPTYVTGVLTQGRNGVAAQWVTKYKVQFEPPSPAEV